MLISHREAPWWCCHELRGVARLLTIPLKTGGNFINFKMIKFDGIHKHGRFAEESAIGWRTEKKTASSKNTRKNLLNEFYV